MTNTKIEKLAREASEAHAWSIDCTCADLNDGSTCWFHLSDTEKARDSFNQGFLAGAKAQEQLMSEKVQKLVDAAKYYVHLNDMPKNSIKDRDLWCSDVFASYAELRLALKEFEGEK